MKTGKVLKAFSCLRTELQLEQQQQQRQHQSHCVKRISAIGDLPAIGEVPAHLRGEVERASGRVATWTLRWAVRKQEREREHWSNVKWYK